MLYLDVRRGEKKNNNIVVEFELSDFINFDIVQFIQSKKCYAFHCLQLEAGDSIVVIIVSSIELILYYQFIFIFNMRIQ